LSWTNGYWLLGGIALFLLGIHLLGEGLKRVLGGRLRWAMTRLAGNPITALGAGAAVTGPMQSSGPATVVLMGLADAGIVTLSQGAVILLGATVGATVIPQLLAFPVARWGLLAVMAGVPLVLFGRWQSWKSFGGVLAGFGLMFYGMHLMTDAVAPVRDSQGARDLLAGFAGRPVLAALAAAALTAVIQSSGAAVAIVMTLVAAGGGQADNPLPPEKVLPLIIGINVGTAAPAIIATLSAGREGRRLVAAYVGFKVVGAVLMLPFAGVLGQLAVDATAAAGGGPARAVANMHTAYNAVLAVVFLLPAGRLASLFARAVPAQEGLAERLARRLSKALSGTPSAALMAAGRELADMGRRTERLVREGLAALEEGGERRIESLKPLDDEIDVTFATMSSYLAKLPAHGLAGPDAERLTRTLYVAKLFEEIGDLVSRDLARLASKRSFKDLEFSMESQAALHRFGTAAADELARICAALEAEGAQAGPPAIPSEEVEAEHRRLLAEHFDQLGRGVPAADETAKIYPDALAVLRDIRRAGAEIARVVKGGEGKS